MNAPDKIYLHPDIGGKEFIRPWLKRAANSESVAYIRKDALLEWAKNLKERWEEPPMSKHSPGCVFMLEQLINKLNSK